MFGDLIGSLQVVNVSTREYLKGCYYVSGSSLPWFGCFVLEFTQSPPAQKPIQGEHSQNQNTQSSPSLLFCAVQNLGPISECTKFFQFDFLLLLCDQNNITQVNNIFWVMVLRGAISYAIWLAAFSGRLIRFGVYRSQSSQRSNTSTFPRKKGICIHSS